MHCQKILDISVIRPGGVKFLNALLDNSGYFCFPTRSPRPIESSLPKLSRALAVVACIWRYWTLGSSIYTTWLFRPFWRLSFFELFWALFKNSVDATFIDWWRPNFNLRDNHNRCFSLFWAILGAFTVAWMRQKGI